MSRKRQEKFSFYLTLDEKEILERKSNKAGVSQGEFLRMLVKGVRIKEKPGKEFNDYLNQLRGMATNLNQLTYKVNAYSYFNENEFENLKEKIISVLLEMENKYLSK